MWCVPLSICDRGCDAGSVMLVLPTYHLCNLFFGWLVVQKEHIQRTSTSLQRCLKQGCCRESRAITMSPKSASNSYSSHVESSSGFTSSSTWNVTYFLTPGVGRCTALCGVVGVEHDPVCLLHTTSQTNDPRNPSRFLKQPVFAEAETQAAALSLLFRLGFSQLGEAYPIAALTDSQRGMLQHLDKLGLVRQREEWCVTILQSCLLPTQCISPSHDMSCINLSRVVICRGASSSHLSCFSVTWAWRNFVHALIWLWGWWCRYYPTGLASLLMRAGAAGDPDQQGFLIVETNFRVFAIEPTDLQVALLSKFVEVQYRFPNMAVGTLTRTSVRGALMNGTQRATLRPLVP